MDFEEAQQEYLHAQNEYDSVWREGLDQPSFKKMEEFLSPYKEKKRLAYIKVLESVPITHLQLTPVQEDHGKYFPISHFKKACESGAFIDYDGFGNLCIGKQVTQYEIWPSLILREDLHLPEIFDGVQWYNR